MIQYRAATADELPAVRRLRYYAFAPEDGPTAFETDETEIMGAHRGLFDDETLLTCCSYFVFTTHLRGTTLPMGGVAGVTSPPERRRQGLVRRLTCAVLEEFHDEGLCIAALWPFDYDFYARLGWAMACTYTRYEVDPEALRTIATHSAGSFRRVEADEWHLLDPVFDTFHEGHELATDRTEEWWRRRVFTRFTDERYVYAWADDSDEIRGYLAYRFEGEGSSNRTLHVDEFAATDPEARRQLFRFLSNHDSQVGSVTLTLPTETMLYDEVADPYAVDCEIEPGPMVRLVSVPDALESIPVPDSVAGSATVAVADPLADWNDDTFECTFADGAATCERAPDSTPDVRLDVNALSQLFVGYRSLADLERLDSVAVENRPGADVLAAALPERSVSLPEGF